MKSKDAFSLLYLLVTVKCEWGCVTLWAVLSWELLYQMIVVCDRTPAEEAVFTAALYIACLFPHDIPIFPQTHIYTI